MRVYFFSTILNKKNQLKIMNREEGREKIRVCNILLKRVEILNENNVLRYHIGCAHITRIREIKEQYRKTITKDIKKINDFNNRVLHIN